MEALPASFYRLLPVGLALNWCEGITLASTVLQTLHLARTMPEEVWLMPALLRRASPDVLSGAIYTVLSLLASVTGVFASMLSDRLGMKASCKVAVAVQAAAQLLVAWPRTYFVGLALSIGAQGASTPIFTALFTSQYDDERLTQKLTTYLYALGNFAFVLATVAAGLQPFWLGYVESAAILVISLATLIVASPSLRVSGDAEKDPVARPGVARSDGRVYGYAVLCCFSFLFWVVFMQFLGGPVLVFAKEGLSPIGGFQVPAQWFLALNGLVDLFAGIPLGWMYEHVLSLRFHAKFRVCFVLMAAACGVLAFAVRANDPGGASPLALAAAMVLVSLGELHYNPVMLATISSEMPANMVGLCTGIFFMLADVGSCVAGMGVPAYAAMGSEAFFLVLCGVAAIGAIGVQLVAPCLLQCFEEESKAECRPLHLIMPLPLASA